MDGIIIRHRTRNRQAHPPRDSADLERIGERSGLVHIGLIVASLVEPLVAEHELEQAFRRPAPFRIQLILEAVEVGTR